MTQPHQCRCSICGEIGTIVPGLPNVFAPIVPTETNLTDAELAAAAVRSVDRAYVDIPTCAHGYRRCMPCKFPPEPTPPPELGMRGAWAADKPEYPLNGFGPSGPEPV